VLPGKRAASWTKKSNRLGFALPGGYFFFMFMIVIIQNIYTKEERTPLLGSASLFLRYVAHLASFNWSLNLRFSLIDRPN
jgi:hypothetical protein